MGAGPSTDDGAERVPLSRERVLAAAMAMADEGGLDALSMRRLGESLGVEAMSLYNHVANKRDVLVGMLDLALTEIEDPDDDAGWQAALTRVATSKFEVLTAHPWAATLLAADPDAGGAAQFHAMDVMLGILRRGGFSVKMTHHAFHVLENFVVGFALQEASFPYDADAMPDLASEFLAGLDTERFPHLAEHVQYHIDTGILGEGDFAFGLELIIDGIERLLPA